MNQLAEKGQLVLPYELSGKTESSKLVVFIHGYPDSNRLWDSIAPPHEKDCLVLKISYPNFDGNMGVTEPWGRSHIQIVHGIKETIDYISNSNGKKYKIFVVSHDWGAYFTYLFDKEYPNMISNAVIMDIGYDLGKNLYDTICGLIYMYILAFAFILPKPVGNALTWLLVSFATTTKSFTPAVPLEYNASMNYHYYYTFIASFYQLLYLLLVYFFGSNKMVFYGSLGVIIFYKLITFHSSNPLNNYKPSFPMAFIYGAEKVFMYHTEEMLSDLKLSHGCEVHGVDRGHWVMLKNEAFINEIIDRRLNSF